VPAPKISCGGHHLGGARSESGTIQNSTMEEFEELLDASEISSFEEVSSFEEGNAAEDDGVEEMIRRSSTFLEQPPAYIETARHEMKLKSFEQEEQDAKEKERRRSARLEKENEVLSRLKSLEQEEETSRIRKTIVVSTMDVPKLNTTKSAEESRPTSRSISKPRRPSSAAPSQARAGPNSRRPKSAMKARSRARRERARLEAENLLLKVELERLIKKEEPGVSKWTTNVKKEARGSSEDFLFGININTNERKQLIKQFMKPRNQKKERLKKREACWDATTSIPEDLLSKSVAPPTKAERERVRVLEEQTLERQRQARLTGSFSWNERPKSHVTMKNSNKRGKLKKKKVKIQKLVKKTEFLEDETRPIVKSEQMPTPLDEKREEELPIDWSRTILFLEREAKELESKNDRTQIEELLLAVENPSLLELLFEKATKELETLWEEVQIPTRIRCEVREAYFGEPTKRNFARLLSRITRLVSLKNRLLTAFGLVKTRERLVEKISRTIDPFTKTPRSSKRALPSPSGDASKVHTINKKLVPLIDEITKDTKMPFILHGLDYSHKMKIDLVL